MMPTSSSSSSSSRAATSTSQASSSSPCPGCSQCPGASSSQSWGTPSSKKTLPRPSASTIRSTPGRSTFSVLPLPSSNSSNATSLRQPSSFMVKTVERTTQAYTMVRSQIFDELYLGFSREVVVTQAQAQEASMIRRVHQEILPLLPNGESSFRWYHKIARFISFDYPDLGMLESLLSKAKINSEEDRLSQKDLDQILAFCERDFAKLSSDKQKRQILCYRIIHCLAEHRWKLSVNAVDRLLIACREAVPKTLPYVGLALGYTIFYNNEIHLPEDIESLLDQTITQLWSRDEKKYLEAIVILIAAKAKLNKDLTQDDLKKIKLALGDERVQNIPLQYRSSTSKDNYPMPNKDLYSFWSVISSLRNLKNHVKSGGLLSNQDFECLYSWYHKYSDHQTRYKILQILRFAISNRQRKFPKEGELHSILGNTIAEFECKYRTEALIIGKTLSVNKTLPSKLISSFYQGRHREQFYALSAFSQHIHNSPGSEDLRNSIWSKLVIRINNNEYSNPELKKLVAFVLFQLEKNPEHFSSLILDPKYSIYATAAYLKDIKSGEIPSDEVLELLKTLILDYNHFEPGTILNAMGVFRYVAEMGRLIDITIINHAMHLLRDVHSDREFKIVALFLLGASLPLQRKNVTSLSLLSTLGGILKMDGFINSISFLLCQWIDAIPTPHFLDKFNHIFQEIIDKLEAPYQTLSTDDKMSLTRILGRAAEKKFEFSQALIDRLVAIARATEEIPFKHRCIQVLSAYYASRSEMFWSKPLVLLLLEMATSEDESHFFTAASLLCHYLKLLVNPPIPFVQMDSFATLFFERKKRLFERQAFLGYTLFQTIVEKKWKLTHDSLMALATTMTDDRLTFYTSIALLFVQASDHQQFGVDVMEKIIQATSSSEEIIVHSSLLVMEKHLPLMIFERERLAKKAIPCLMGVVQTTYQELADRLKSLMILSQISTNDRELSFPLANLDQLRVLLTDYHEQIRLSALQLLALQVSHLKGVIVSQHSLIVDIESAIVPFLEDENLQKDAIEVLTTLGLFGHRLTTNTFLKISKILYCQYDFTIAKKIFSLLGKYKNELPVEVSKLILIQEIFDQLTHPRTSIKSKINPMNRLIQNVEEREKIIVSVFEVIINLIDKYVKLQHTSSFNNLFEKVLEFGHKVLEIERLPFPKLLQSICAVKEGSLTPSNRCQRALLVATYLRAKHSVDPTSFPILERGFLSAELKENTLVYLEAIDVTVKRGFSLQKKTIELLWVVLFHSFDKRESLASNEILIALAEVNQSEFIESCSQHMKELLALVSTVHSKKKFSRIGTLIQQIQKSISFRENERKKIYQIILNLKNFEQQYQLCQLLRPDHQEAIPKEHSLLIESKDIESRVLQSMKVSLSQRSFEDITRDLESLSDRGKALSIDFFKQLNALLSTLKKDEIHVFLSTVLQIARRHQIPPFLIHSFFTLKKERFLLRSMEILIVTLSHTNEINNELNNKSIFTILENVIFESPNDELRSFALEILKKFSQHLCISQELQSLVEIECIELSNEGIDRLSNDVSKRKRLSYSHAQRLISKLESNQFVEQIIEIFDVVKVTLPEPLIKKLFFKYQDFLFNSHQIDLFVVDFFLYAIYQNKINAFQAEALFHKICRKIENDTPLTTSKIVLLKAITSSYNFEVKDNLLIKWLNCYVVTKDLETRKRFLFFLFERFIEMNTWSKTFFDKLILIALHYRSIVPVSEEFELTALKNSQSLLLLNPPKNSLLGKNLKTLPALSDILKEIEIYFHLISFILEHPNSESFCRKKGLSQSPLAISNTLVFDRVKKNISISSDLEWERFEELMSDLKKQLNQKNYSQLLRMILFKSYERKIGIAEINQRLEIFSCFPQSSLTLFFQGFDALERHFLKSLLHRFDSFQSDSKERQNNLLKRCAALTWSPKWRKWFLEQLDPSTPMEELLNLFELLTDFSMDQKFLEDEAFLTFQVTDLRYKLMTYHLVERLRPLFDSASYEARSADDRQMREAWLSFAVNNALSLCKQGWDFKKLMNWLQAVNDHVENRLRRPFDIRNMADLLAMTTSYFEQISEEKFYSLSNQEINRGSMITSTILHTHVIKTYLNSNNPEKGLKTLLTEIGTSQTNQQDQLLMDSVYPKKIKRILESAEDLYNRPYIPPFKQMNVPQRPINAWSKKDIQNWAATIKRATSRGRQFEKNLPYCLAIFKQVCLLEYKYLPRNVQLLAVILLTQRANPGILGQIATGEGKSLIIAMLATIQALQGKNVDVITSSPILASRDTRDYTPFYDYFSLKAASNEDHQYTDGLKACYAKKFQIVYGDPSHFLFDHLRETYSLLGTRGERAFHVSIMDEVDNVLIEGNDTVAMLANPIPCMQELNPLLMFIWLKLSKFDHLKDESLRNPGDENNLFFGIDLKNKSALQEMIEKELIAAIDEYTNLNPNYENEKKECSDWIVIPEHLKDFAHHRKKDWVRSAYLAFYEYKLQHHYEIKLNQHEVPCIAPIDFANTGVIQLGTSWGDGLHQFLCFKHLLPFESLTLVTNYFSIYTYIHLYPKAIGITGTLGSPQLQELMLKMYNYSSLEIPTFLPKRNVKLIPQILPNKTSWEQAIGFGAIREAKLGRVVLIICETIELARQIDQRIHSIHPSVSTHLYADDNTESRHFFDRELVGNTIIVATNLAGRGTDIRLAPEVIQRGGLHVCVTLLPDSSRVELQAFGRTSRRGEPGSVQMILNLEDLQEKLIHATKKDFKRLELDPHFIEELRNREESKKLAVIEEEKLPDLKIQGQLFNDYLSLLEEVRVFDKNHEDSTVFKAIEKEIEAEAIYREELIKVKRNALEERWGRWLRQSQSSKDKSKLLKDFQTFRQTLFKSYRQENIIDNPIYYIVLGNQLLSRAGAFHHLFIRETLLKYAIQSYEAAIKIDPDFSYNAYYHCAYALIQQREKGYRKKAIKLLEKTIATLMDGPMKQHHAMELCLNERKSESEDTYHLITQLEREKQVHHLIIASARQAIEEIKVSQKLIEVSFVNDCFSAVPERRQTGKESKHFLSHYKTNVFTITLHHLKTHPDLWAQSQLREMIVDLPSGVSPVLTFYSDKLSTPGETLAALLPINRDKKKLLEKLKQETPNPSDTLPPSSLASSSSSSSSSACSSSTASQSDSVSMTALEYGKDFASKGFQLLDSVSDKFGQLKSTIGNHWKKLEEWLYEYSETDKFLVNLKIKQLSAEEILSSIDSLPIKLRQRFGIGPIKMSPALFRYLKRNHPQIQIVVWIPSQDNNEQGSFPHYASVNDVELQHPQVEISILNCTKQSLIDFLKYIPQEKVRNLQLILHQLEQQKAETWIEKIKRPMALSFLDLNIDQMQKIVDLTSDEHNQATLSFQEISHELAQLIIKKAPRSKEGKNDVTINHRDIKEEFIKISQHPSFLNRYRLNGYFYLYEVKEKLPLPWRSLMLLSTLSAAQIASGVALNVFTAGFGSAIGSGLISEGITEIFRIIPVGLNREFDVSNYVQQKAISLALTFGTAAWISTDTAVNAESSVRSSLNAITNHGDEAVLLMGKFRNAPQHVMLELGEATVKEGTKIVINHTSDSVIKHVEPDVQREMKRAIENMFNKDNWKKALNKLFAIDDFLQNTEEMNGLKVAINEIFTKDDFEENVMKAFNCDRMPLFEKYFPDYLSSRSEALQDIYDIICKKLVEYVPKRSMKGNNELRKALDWLKRKEIINSLGEVNHTKLSEYASKPLSEEEKYRSESYNLKRLTFCSSFEQRRSILGACLSYSHYLENDYFVQRKEIILFISTRFHEEYLGSLKTLGEIAKVGINQVISCLVSDMNNQVTTQVRRERYMYRRGEGPSSHHGRVVLERVHPGFISRVTHTEHVSRVFVAASPPGISAAQPIGLDNRLASNVLRAPRLVVDSSNPIRHRVPPLSSRMSQSRDDMLTSTKRVLRSENYIGLSSSSGDYVASRTGKFSGSYVPPPRDELHLFRERGCVERGHFKRGRSLRSEHEHHRFGERTPLGQQHMRGYGSHLRGGYGRGINGTPRLKLGSMTNIRSTVSGGGFSIRTICSHAVEFNLATLRILCLNEYEKSIIFNIEKEKSVLASHVLRQAQDSGEIFRELRAEHTKLIKCLIGLLLLEVKFLEGEDVKIDETEQQEIDNEIDCIFNEGRTRLEEGKNSISKSFRDKIGNVDGPCRGYLIHLVQAWNKYRYLERREKGVFGSVERIVSVNVREELGDLIAHKNYTDLGILLQQQSFSSKEFIQGVMVEQLGNLAKGYIDRRKMSILGNLRLQCIALNLVQDAISNHTVIQTSTVEIVQQRDQLTEKIVTHQTLFAKIIVERYKDFLERIVKASSIEEIERISSSYNRERERIDARVTVQARVVKRFAIDQEVLKQCSKQAQEIVTLIVEKAKTFVNTSTHDLHRNIKHIEQGFTQQETTSNNFS